MSRPTRYFATLCAAVTLASVAYLHGRHVERWACIVEASEARDTLTASETEAYWASFDGRD